MRGCIQVITGERREERKVADTGQKNHDEDEKGEQCHTIVDHMSPCTRPNQIRERG